MRLKLISVIIGAGLVSGIWWGLRESELSSPSAPYVSPSLSASPDFLIEPIAEVSALPPIVESPSSEVLAADWLAQTQSILGVGVKIRTDARGRLLEARGALQKGKASPALTKKQMNERIATVIAAIKPGLGAVELAELRQSDGAGKATERVTHAVASQLWEGTPVEPRGSLSLDLGPRGEVIGIYPDLIEKKSLRNQRKLSVDQAQAELRKMLPAPGDQRILGRRLVVWTNSGGEGWWAYDFTAGGERWVIDAERGEVLYRKQRMTK